MAPLLRSLVFAGLSLAPLGAACESLPPTPSVENPAAPAPAPPPLVISICDRNAKPTTGDDAKTIASFEAFSRDWIEKMRRVGAARGLAGRKRIRDAYEMELRPTRSAQAPYIGVLRYCEIGLSCAAAGEPDAISKTAVISVNADFFMAGFSQKTYPESG